MWSMGGVSRQGWPPGLSGWGNFMDGTVINQVRAGAVWRLGFGEG